MGEPRISLLPFPTRRPPGVGTPLPEVFHIGGWLYADRANLAVESNGFSSSESAGDKEI